ncbi:MAG: FHA domain-containing protein [Elusimicrobiota bacterium]
MPRIIVKNKAEIIMEYILGNEKVTVGRSKGNKISIDDQSLSEEHCIISRGKDNFMVEDLNTAFGTTVNGKNISKQEINIGDEIGAGAYSLILKPTGKEKTKKSAIAGADVNAFMLGIQGKMEGKKYEMNPVETRIGRSKEFNDIWISKEIDKSVSRRHTTIVYKDDKFILTDRRSRNRTFVNQRQINENDEVIIKDRDEILIGKSIFRFIRGSKEDYSSPEKAGIFIVRVFPKLKKILGFVMLAAGLFVTFRGVSGLSVIYSRPADLYIDNMNWKPEGFMKTWKGYLPKDVLDITPSPAIGDINGDKIPEIVMADAMGRVYAWSGVNGYLLWENELGQSTLTSPVLADMNNDNVLDVIVGVDNSRVYVLDGNSGQMIYKSSFIGGKLLFGSSPLVDDLDGDGFKDIVVTTDDKVVCFLYTPVTGTQKPYFFRTPENILSSPVVLRSTMGVDKVAIATNGGKVYIFDVANPENREVVDITQKINMLRGVNLVLNEISSIPAVADMDGDGADDLVFTTGAYYVTALNSQSHSLMWAYKLRPFSVLGTPLRYASPVLTELDMDGVPDVITGWANGKVVALSGRTGELLWEHESNAENRIISSIALADFNKDGIMDPVVTGEDGSIVILNGSIDTEARVLSNQAFVQGSITSTPAIGDVNSDGYLEIVVTTVNNTIAVLATATQVFKNEIIWQSFRGTSTNSGALFFVSKSMIYQVFAGAGIAIVFIVLFLMMILRKKKLSKRPKIIDGRKK